MPQEGWYEIHIEGNLTSRWAGWFEGLEIAPGVENETVLRGPLRDQSELHGVLMKIRDLRLVLLSVQRVQPPEKPG